MTNPAAAPAVDAPKVVETRDLSKGLFYAFLSYLVPGLGQIVQGRVAKGIVFLVCIYGLFFYGMWLGSGTAVVNGETYVVAGNVYLPHTALKNNPLNLKPLLLADLYNRPQFAGQFWVGAVVWPAVIQYVRYDDRRPEGLPLLGTFMRAPPDDAANNAVEVAHDKTMGLGWVYTVIAGVLNIMVMYDALNGPTFAGRRKVAPRPQGGAA